MNEFQSMLDRLNTTLKELGADGAVWVDEDGTEHDLLDTNTYEQAISSGEPLPYPDTQWAAVGPFVGTVLDNIENGTVDFQKLSEALGVTVSPDLIRDVFIIAESMSEMCANLDREYDDGREDF